MHWSCKNVKTKAGSKHENTRSFVSNPSWTAPPHHQSSVLCLTSHWQCFPNSRTVHHVRGHLSQDSSTPPSLSRVSQKVWGRATPPPCQGRGSHSHNIPHAEMTWHLLFNSFFTKGLQLHKIASCTYKFIFPYSSVLQGVNSFPSLFCTFCSTSSCMLFWVFFLKEFFSGFGWFFSFIEILQKYLVAL